MAQTRKHLGHLPWTQKHDVYQHQTQENHQNAHARRSWDKKIRLTGYCGCVRRILRGALHVNYEDTRTQTRGQVPATPRYNEAVHDARTQQRDQPTAADTRGIDTEMIKILLHKTQKKNLLQLHNKAIKPHEQPPPN